jgi:hypothetical protein
MPVPLGPGHTKAWRACANAVRVDLAMYVAVEVHL